MSSPPTLPIGKLIAKYVLIAFIGCGAVVLGWEIMTWVHPPLLALGLGALNRKPMCGTLEAYHGVAKHDLQARLTAQISQASHLVQTETTGLSLWDTPDGRYWIPTTSSTVLPVLLAQQASDIYSSSSVGVRTGDIVLDCGAHVGVYTRKALAAGASLVVAIEPAKANLECLRRNFKAEIAAGRVVICPKGVWDKEELLPLYENPDNSAGDSFVIRASQDVVANSIPLTTIDNIVAEMRLSHVGLIKMDIKGATEKALQGAKRTLTRDKPRIAISTEEVEDDPIRLTKQLRGMQLGYNVACGTCSVTGRYMLNPDVLFFE